MNSKRPFSSLTPRTDALAARIRSKPLELVGTLCVWEHAEQLERELSESNAIRAELLAALKHVAGWLESFRAPVTTTEAEKVGVLAQIEQAIAKAEGK